MVFVCSVISSDLQWARHETVRWVDEHPYLLTRWAFELTPASSQQPAENYLRKVRESDIVVWLAESKTTVPVQNEIREALASDRRLWVMRLPAERRDDATQALLVEVERRIKWMDIGSADALRQALEETLKDEIARAMRGKPELGRLARLDELARASRGRCVARWQAAGVLRSEALQLADDRFAGAPPPEFVPRAERPFLVIVGDMGAGKSLIGERLLQAAIAAAHDNVNGPVPVYLEAQDASEGLQPAVSAQANGLGNPAVQGASVVIDGADEAGSRVATDLLEEARILVTQWPRTSVVITTRPLPGLTTIEEMVEVPMLAETEAHGLISRFAGRPVTWGMAFAWPRSVQDAIRRPLFAILLGTYIARSEVEAPRSVGGMLSSLVERSLPSAATSRLAAQSLMQRLAVLSIDRGSAAVPKGEVARSRDLAPLLDSGLVTEHMGALRFGLPILAEWFAAQSLGAGTPAIQGIVRDTQRLERWRYPLIIATSLFGHDDVSAFLKPLAEDHPAVAAQIVNEAVSRWGFGEDVSPPPPHECGKRIRGAMEAWISGVGALAQLIAPLGRDGFLLPLGVGVAETWLYSAWYQGDAGSSSVMDLSSLPKPLTQPGEFARLRGAHPARQPAWAWRWTLEDLTSSLSQLLRKRALPVSEGPLLRERVWQAALVLLGQGSLNPRPIPVVDLEPRLSGLPPDIVIGGAGQRPFAAELLRNAIRRIRESGETELRAPWPGPDRDVRGGGWVWDLYSPERTLERAVAVYAAALQGYQQIVTKWFQCFAPRLATAATLPATLVGTVAPGRPGSGLAAGPAIGWHLEPLPFGSKSGVDLRLTDDPREVDVLSLDLAPLSARLRAIRGEASAWLRPIACDEVLDIFHPDSATELVYEWLWHDLKDICWVEGLLGGR